MLWGPSMMYLHGQQPEILGLFRLNHGLLWGTVACDVELRVASDQALVEERTFERNKKHT